MFVRRAVLKRGFANALRPLLLRSPMSLRVSERAEGFCSLHTDAADNLSRGPWSFVLFYEVGLDDENRTIGARPADL